MNALVQTEEFLETIVRLLSRDMPVNSWLNYDDLTRIEMSAVKRLAIAGLAVLHFDHTLFQRRWLLPERKAAFYFKASGRDMMKESLRRAWQNAINLHGFKQGVESRSVLGAEGLFAQLSEHGAVARSDLRNRQNLSFVYEWLQNATADTELIEVAYLEPLRTQQGAKQQAGDRGINLVAMPGSTISNINTGDLTWHTEHHFHDAVEGQAKSGGDSPFAELPPEIADALAHRPMLHRLAAFMWDRKSAEATDLVPYVYPEHRSDSAISTAANDINNALEQTKCARRLATRKGTIFWKNS